MPVDPKLFERLETMGENSVRRDFMSGLSGDAGSEHSKAVAGWLKSKEDARSNERDSRTLAIAEEALSIAKIASRIASENLAIARFSAESARSNARWAMYAAIVATVAALIAAKDQILALIFRAS
jgi:hypothetical protein